VHQLPRDQLALVRDGKRTLLIIPRRGPGHEPPYPVGARIALARAFGRPAVCRVVVTRVSDVAVGELDELAARGLGHADLASFRAWWRERHGDDLEARAWLLKVHLDLCEPPRLLRRRGGYTSDPSLAVDDAGEAVDDYALAGNTRAAQHVEERRVDDLLAHRAKRQPYDRLAMVMGDAEARGIDIARPLHVVVQRIEQMEQLVYRAADRTANLD
jgi:hypothetical protein